MKLHGNARTCPRSRRLLVERLSAGWTALEATLSGAASDRLLLNLARRNPHDVYGIADHVGGSLGTCRGLGHWDTVRPR